MNASIKNIISERCYEGHLYMYDEQPENILLLEDYLLSNVTYVNTIYRRTDWLPLLNAKEGDVIEMTRISSWSYDNEMPDAMYEGIDSRMLILEHGEVRGVDVSDISFYKDEDEILLSPCTLYIKRQINDTLYVKIV